MRPDRLVYLSGPITARDGYSVEENVASALKVYLECLNSGIAAFCPHLSGAFPSSFSDVPYERWMDYDLVVIKFCTHVMMLPRWASSPGASRERDFALANGIPVIYSLKDLT